jgi:hypothetical protein
VVLLATKETDMSKHSAYALAALAFGAVAPAGQAQQLSEAELFFELNDTDGDLGIHASIDGGPYTRLEIEDPRGRELLLVQAKGNMARQGLTQLFLESAEPSFDELDPAVFFARFPEGIYEIEALAQTGREVGARVQLSHVLAAPPDGITVAGEPVAENCDDPNLPVVSEPVLIDWEPVTTSHPELGRSGSVSIVRYQFFVERPGVKISVDLPPDVTEFLVPADILALGDDFKFEIIARTSTGNNTAIENCFLLE